MSNPNPKTDHLKPYQASRYATTEQNSSALPLAEKPLTIRVPVDIDEAIRALPNRSEWMRKVLTEAAQRELLTQSH